MYDYVLGGKDNFAADRRAVDEILAIAPYIQHVALDTRAFLGRAVRFIATQGVRQFLDLGSGLPTQRNVHEIVHEVAPDARVVYVDYDAVAASHGQALLADSSTVGFVRADLRDPDGLLQDSRVQELIDFDRPVAILLFNMLHSIAEEEDPDGIIAMLRRAVPPGSHLAVSHAADGPAADHAVIAKALGAAGIPYLARSRERITGFFGDWRIESPGVVECHEWRPERPEPLRTGDGILAYAGVARKP